MPLYLLVTTFRTTGTVCCIALLVCLSIVTSIGAAGAALSHWLAITDRYFMRQQNLSVATKVSIALDVLIGCRSKHAAFVWCSACHVHQLLCLTACCEESSVLQRQLLTGRFCKLQGIGLRQRAVEWAGPNAVFDAADKRLRSSTCVYASLWTWPQSAKFQQDSRLKGKKGPCPSNTAKLVTYKVWVVFSTQSDVCVINPCTSQPRLHSRVERGKIAASDLHSNFGIGNNCWR